MNPDPYEKAPSFNLPAVQGEQGQSGQAEQFVPPVTEEQATIATEQGISQPGGAPPADPGAAPPAPQGQQASDPQGSTAAGAGPLPAGWMPQIADDTDLIEKEWVDKAKEIVARTAQDPYNQNKEMNKIKADYLKKRYNKDMKLSED